MNTDTDLTLLELGYRVLVYEDTLERILLEASLAEAFAEAERRRLPYPPCGSPQPVVGPGYSAFLRRMETARRGRLYEEKD